LYSVQSSDPNHEDFESEEEFNEWMENYQDGELEAVKYLLTGNYKNVGYISCGVWRFEVTDFEKGKEIIDFKSKKKNDWQYRDIVVVDIPGTKVSMEHYFDSIGKSPISNAIVSKITIE
jgi:hypothetical protein